MSKNNGPWGNDSPWNEPENTASPGKVRDFANIKKPGGFDFKISWIIAAVALLWLATGFYQVQTNEQGVVLRFGKYADTTDAGLHYHLPYPIEEVVKVNITQERSINLGVAEAYTTANRVAIRNGQTGNADPLKHLNERDILEHPANIDYVSLTVESRY